MNLKFYHKSIFYTLDAPSTVAKGKNGCKLLKMGIFVSNFEKYFVV